MVLLELFSVKFAEYTDWILKFIYYNKIVGKLNLHFAEYIFVI